MDHAVSYTQLDIYSLVVQSYSFYILLGLKYAYIFDSFI